MKPQNTDIQAYRTASARLACVYDTVNGPVNFIGSRDPINDPINGLLNGPISKVLSTDRQCVIKSDLKSGPLNGLLRDPISTPLLELKSRPKSEPKK